VNRQLVVDFINKHPTKVVSSINLKNGKITYSDIVQGRNLKDITGDEEMVRAFILTRLVNELGYDPSRIEIEREYTAGRPHTKTTRIDVIVRDEHGNAFLFMELKPPKDYNSEDKDLVIEEQLFKVSGMERTDSGKSVKYLVLYTIADSGNTIVDECIIIDNEKFQTFSEWVDSDRESVNNLPERYGKAQKRLYIKASEKDLETDFSHESLNRLQTDLHNVLWGGGGTDDNEVFSSLTNLILAKIQDEDEKDDGDVYDFQSFAFANEAGEEFESNIQLFDRINNLYRRALKDKLYISDEDELQKSYVIDSKKFSLSKLKYTVQKFEGLSFVEGRNSLNGKDILGDFFESIIRSGFKQTKGQFFTHINIVRFMLWGLQLDRLTVKNIKEKRELPYMIDPSAGSGTFLLEYMKFITQNMKYRFISMLGSSNAVRQKFDTWFMPDYHEHKWAKEYIYANEINFNLGTAIKVNMILHGDGSTNIFVKDGLLPFTNYIKETSNILVSNHPDSSYNNIAVNECFDVILTNPPFSVQLDNDTKKTLSKSFAFGSKKNSENLFIERWYQLLRENGRLAAVLPESIFDTTENKYIRLFIYKYFKIKAVVSLPQSAFQPYTLTKTSVLFAQKKLKSEVNQWNNKWEEASKTYSFLKTRVENIISVYEGKKQKSKLPSIKELDEAGEINVLKLMLKNYLTQKDIKLTKGELIKKYKNDLFELCSYDKDTVDLFGFVNTWWVFNEVANELNYTVFMAEASNVGYKRSGGKNPRENKMPNDLYRIAENEVVVDDGEKLTILDYMRDIVWD